MLDLSRVPQLRIFTPTGPISIPLHAYRVDKQFLWYVLTSNEGPSKSAEIYIGDAMIANACGTSYNSHEIDARIEAKNAELSLSEEDRASQEARNAILS